MKRETKVRLALFLGSAAILMIVAVFLWLINGSQGEAAKGTFFTYMGILGGLSILSLGVFFAFYEVFDREGHVYISRIITMLVSILMLVQLALAFSAYTNRSMDFSFTTFRRAYNTVTRLDAGEDRQTVLHESATEEFDYMAIADESGAIVYATDPALIGRDTPDDGALSFVLYGGGRFLAEPSDSYHAAVITEMIVSQLTLLVISLMFSVEFVMFIVGRVSRIGEKKEEKEQAPAILVSVRQIAFLFYFASRLSASFIPVLAKSLPVGGLALAPNLVAALPTTAETFFTCFAILFTNSLLSKRGWRPPFLLGLTLVALGTLLSAFSPTLVIFTLSRGVIGLGYGFCWMTLRSVALFGKDAQARMWGFSMLNAGLYAGMFCGSTVGSIIAVSFGYQTVLIVSAALIAVCGAYILTMVNHRLPAPQKVSRADKAAREKLPARDKIGFVLFLALMIAPSCVVVAYSGYFLPLYYEGLGRGVLDVGRAQLLYGLLIVYVGPMLSSRFARGRGMAGSNFLYNLILAGALIVLGASGGFAASLIAIAMIALGDGFGFGVQNTCFLAMPVARRLGDSRALMYLSLSKKLMEMLGPTAFALVMSGTDTRGILAMGAVFAVCAGAYAIINYLLHRRKTGANA